MNSPGSRRLDAALSSAKSTAASPGPSASSAALCHRGTTVGNQVEEWSQVTRVRLEQALVDMLALGYQLAPSNDLLHQGAEVPVL